MYRYLDCSIGSSFNACSPVDSIQVTHQAYCIFRVTGQVWQVKAIFKQAQFTKGPFPGFSFWGGVCVCLFWVGFVYRSYGVYIMSVTDSLRYTSCEILVCIHNNKGGILFIWFHKVFGVLICVELLAWPSQEFQVRNFALKNYKLIKSVLVERHLMM